MTCMPRDHAGSASYRRHECKSQHHVRVVLRYTEDVDVCMPKVHEGARPKGTNRGLNSAVVLGVQNLSSEVLSDLSPG